MGRLHVEVPRQPNTDRDEREQALGRPVALPNLRMRVSERKLLLFLVDLLIVNAALVLALELRADFAASARNLLLNAKWFVTLSLVWILWALFFDAYELARAASAVHGVRSAVSAVAATFAVYTFTPWFTPSLQSRLLIFLFTAIAIVGIGVWRLTYAKLFIQPWFRQRALVVGAGWAGRTLVSALRAAPDSAPNPFRGTGYQIVGFVDDDPAYRDTRIDDVPVLGNSEALVPLVNQLQVDEIILAITHHHLISQELFDALLRCRERGLRLATMSVLYERLLGRVPVEHVGRALPTVVPMEESPGERLYAALKRIADLVLAVGGLLVTAALTPFFALSNAITSPGPLFYRQERVGRGGATFQMLKFRTMIPDAEPDGRAVWACVDDQRITSAGRALRGMRLDELPQCWNVLRGEMSVIGPRPERPEFVEELADQLPFYRVRHAIRPGITGWAQIHFDYGSSVEDTKIKLEYDLYYVKHANLFLDLRILLKTVPVILLMKGY